MNKQQTILAAGGAVSAVLVLGAGFLTYSSWSAAADAEREMDSAKSGLARMYREPVFPSDANVETFQTNLLLARTWVADLSRGVFRDGIAVDDSVTRGDFGRVCRETVQALVADAPLNAAEVPVVDADASFGFDHYMQDKLPEREEYVPRLLRQLRLVDRLVRILYASGVNHVDAVGRELFDLAGSRESGDFSSAPVRGRGRGRGSAGAPGGGASSAPKTIAVPPPRFEPDPSVPMSCERLGFLFSTRQEGLVAAINAIDAMHPFAMVSGLSIEKTGQDVVVPAAPDPAKEEAAPPKTEGGILEKPAPRTARLVSGPLFETPVRVTLFVDVFAPVSAVGPAVGPDEAEEEEE